MVGWDCCDGWYEVVVGCGPRYGYHGSWEFGNVQRGAYLGVQFRTVKTRRKATARPMTFVTGRPHFGKRKGCFFSNGRVARRGHQLPGHFEKSGPQYPIKLTGPDLSFKITTTCFFLLDQYVFWTTSVSRKDD